MKGDSGCQCPACQKELLRQYQHIARRKRGSWARMVSAHPRRPSRNQYSYTAKITPAKRVEREETVINRKGDWEGIPGEWIEDATAIDGQRFVAAPGAVHKMRQRMRLAAQNRCEFCSNFAYHGDRHHVFGRGIGGGKREDRPVVAGVRFVIWTCRTCHEEQVIKPWGSWSLQSVPTVERRVAV